mgnify:CR=1 FL=1
MIFDNKYIDYSAKSKKELYETLILFLLLSNKWIVSIGKYLLNIALLLRIPILGIIKKTIFKHFCGGENIIESQKRIHQLGQYNIKTILDYSIEGKNNTKILEQTFNEIIKNLELARNNDFIPFSVFKITGIVRYDLLKKINTQKKLNDDDSKELVLVKDKLLKICQIAEECNKPILIDAEESWIQDGIDKLVEELMYKFNKKRVLIYNTIQLYRWDRLKYIKDLHLKSKRENFKIGLKLVRGAYMEKERRRASKKNYKSPIHSTKEDCDNDFNAASEYCLNHLEDMALCFGTHNEMSTHYIIELMKKKEIKNNDQRIYFSQLLGMSDNISFYLGHFNYNVAKYVPYGPIKQVIPYLIRRAEENSSISGQTNREIIRIREVIKKH